MSLFSFGVAFLPESECKSIADFRTVQAFMELFFRNIHKTLIMRKINFTRKPWAYAPRLHIFRHYVACDNFRIILRKFSYLQKTLQCDVSTNTHVLYNCYLTKNKLYTSV